MDMKVFCVFADIGNSHKVLEKIFSTEKKAKDYVGEQREYDERLTVVEGTVE